MELKIVNDLTKNHSGKKEQTNKILKFLKDAILLVFNLFKKKHYLTSWLEHAPNRKILPVN